MHLNLCNLSHIHIQTVINIKGEVVDPELAFQINKERGLHGKPSVVPRIKSYDEEKDHLEDLYKGAEETVSQVGSILCDFFVHQMYKILHACFSYSSSSGWSYMIESWQDWRAQRMILRTL